MSAGVVALLGALVAIAIAYAARWYQLERKHPGRPKLRSADLIAGFVTNFFDALGIGNFAPTTAVFKLLKRMPDEEIPGTLNAGHALPVIAEALIFIGVVSVDLATLIGMIAAAVAGAWWGAGIVSRLPRRAIQIAMGLALTVAALLFLAKNLGWGPAGGLALGLSGPWFAFALAVSFVLGALMMIGVGLYAPCLILVSLLGMNPLAAFPIMMGACAFLMPVGGVRFIREGRYDLSAALGLTLGGIPGVLIAALIVKSLPLTWLRWLVVVVVLYAAALMLGSAFRRNEATVEIRPTHSSP
jgi:uncharacterized membrane protein YfcA